MWGHATGWRSGRVDAAVGQRVWWQARPDARRRRQAPPPRAGWGSLGWGRAARHLERQLAPFSHRSGGAVPGAPRGRRARPAGDQGARGPAPADGAAVDGLRARLQRPQPVERRRRSSAGWASRTSRSASPRCPGTATRWPPRPARSGPRAPAYACGRCTSPTAARSTTRTTSTSSTGWPGCARRPRAGAATTSRWSATGTSRRATRTSSTWRPTPTPPTSPPPERAAFQAFLDDGWVDVVRPHAPGPDVFTYWDYYRQRFERNRGMRIDFVARQPVPRRPGDPRVHRPRRARRAGRVRPRAGGGRP